MELYYRFNQRAFKKISVIKERLLKENKEYINQGKIDKYQQNCLQLMGMATVINIIKLCKT